MAVFFLGRQLYDTRTGALAGLLVILLGIGSFFLFETDQQEVQFLFATLWLLMLVLMGRARWRLDFDVIIVFDIAAWEGDLVGSLLVD